MSSEPARTELDDAELRVEREYLEDVRAALRYMYEDIINTETQASAPAEDNDIFLEREAMQLGRERRALTRAVSSLHVLRAEPLPAELS